MKTAYGVAAAGVLGVLVTLLADPWFDINYEHAADLSLLYAAVLVNAFTLLYGFRSNWRANRIGRVYLIKSIMMSVFLDQVVLAIWWDELFPGRQHIRFVIYSLTAIVYIPMIVALWREQQRDREETSPPPRSDAPPL